MITIRGIVIDQETRRPMDRVSVVVPGTGRGTTTDSSGGFALPANINEQVVFSHVGYDRKAFNVADLGGQLRSIELVFSPELLEEVVIKPRKKVSWWKWLAGGAVVASLPLLASIKPGEIQKEIDAKRDT